MGVSAVVVTYNRLSLLKECLHRLLEQSYHLDNIFIINNDSNDGTKDWLNSLDKKIIKPINVRKNLGGAGGFSLGVKLAYEKSSSDYFWLMDDDTMPLSNALLALVSSAHKLHNNIGYLCSNVRWWKNDKPSYMNVPVASKDWNDLLNDGLVKTISASFVSLLVPRMLVKKVGLPIADMFIWGDDVEYTTRLSHCLNSYLVANSIVLHKSQSNSTNESVFNVSINRLIYYRCMFRNRLYISRKYYKFRTFLKMLFVYLLCLIKVPFLSKNYWIKRFICVLGGIVSSFFFYPKIQFPKKE